MALIDCPECGKQISDKAKSCPNCGFGFERLKFCKHCGEKIAYDSVICVKCGKQVEENSKISDSGITINNVANSSSSASATSQNINKNIPVAKPKQLKEINKNTALILCIIFGFFGAHKFYEGKGGMGILYLFTGGLFGIGWIVDIVTIATKPNPYYVEI